MSTRPPAPLDAEERALAARLAADAPAGPSPDLDARIRALARDAVSGPAAGAAPARPVAAPAGQRRRRWPAAMGLAATLALAIGLAWQLRPLPEAVPVQREAPPAAARSLPAPAPAPAQATDAPAAEPLMAEGFTGAPLPSEAAPGSPAAPASAAPADLRRASAASPPATIAARPEATAATPEPDPPVVYDEPSPIDVPAPPPAPAPPPSPPAPPAPRHDGVTAEAPARAAAAPAAGVAKPRVPAATAVGQRAVRAMAAPTPVAADAADARTAAVDAYEGVHDDGELDESPPATADSPAVHRAWLDRIRELRDAGRLEAARESLAELRRRFPDVRIPDDLAPLADPVQ